MWSPPSVLMENSLSFPIHRLFPAKFLDLDLESKSKQKAVVNHVRSYSQWRHEDFDAAWRTHDECSFDSPYFRHFVRRTV